jgi:hypothetical protein
VCTRSLRSLPRRVGNSPRRKERLFVNIDDTIDTIYCTVFKYIYRYAVVIVCTFKKNDMFSDYNDHITELPNYLTLQRHEYNRRGIATPHIFLTEN